MTASRIVARPVSITLLAGLLILGGCASYTTPPRGAKLPAAASDKGIAKEFEKKPAATFPAHLALARVQSGAYRHFDPHVHGRGKYTVVTTREVEKDQHWEKISDWPALGGAAPLNRMILPEQINGLKDLRRAAAKLHADILLAYTFDTSFTIDHHTFSGLDAITLGLLPNNEAKITTTASAAFYDVRTGYVYGLAEATASHNELASAWDEQDAVDDARRKAERKSFDKLVQEAGKSWKGIVKRYGSSEPPEQ